MFSSWLRNSGRILFIVLAVLESASTARGDCPLNLQISGQYFVRLRKPSNRFSGIIQRQEFFKQAQENGVRLTAVFDPMAEQSLNTPTPESLEDLPPPTYISTQIDFEKLAWLQSLETIDSIEPDCHAQLYAMPNDPSYAEQWGLEAIHAPTAWNMGTGSTDVIVAISDTGVDYLHEDLNSNMWVNSKEKSGAVGVDDDGNGYADDIYGYDFANKKGDPSPKAGDKALDHGTHVAGIVGAVGNNKLGVTGVAQHVRLMALKGFSDGSGDADTSNLISTIYYAVNNGARIINCSWGHPGTPLQAELDAFAYARTKGVVVVVAAGNDNQDSRNFSPASIASVITVAATDRTDGLASFSNWGTKIDLAAPGGKGFSASGQMMDAVFSTLPRASGNYGGKMGTSMAAPFVSGLAALILSAKPGLTPDVVLNIMRSSADWLTMNSTNGGAFKYPRINAEGAVNLAKGMVVANPPKSDCKPGGMDCNTTGSGSPSKTAAKALSSSSGGCGLMRNISETQVNRDALDRIGFGISETFTLLALLAPVFLALNLRRKTRDLAHT